MSKADNGDDMETNEKTFRYTYIFKNLGTFYLIFLVIVFIISLFGRDFVFFVCDGVMIAGGLIFVTWYLTTHVKVSEFNIATKTILGSKSLKWSEVGCFSARGSSTRLHNYDDNTVLSIGSRLDGYTEIFELLDQKRPDLFDIHKYKSFSHNNVTIVAWLVFGVAWLVFGLLAGFGVIGYVRDIYVSISFGIGFGILVVRILINWYYSPRSLILGTNNLDISYLRKTVSIPIDAIVDIGLGGQQQINSVLVLFKDRRALNLSGYNQSPIVMYYVLKRWLQTYGIGTQAAPT